MKEKDFLSAANQLKATQTRNQNSRTTKSPHKLGTIAGNVNPVKRPDYKSGLIRERRIIQMQEIKYAIENEIPQLYQEAVIGSLNAKLQKIIVGKEYGSGLYLWGGVGTGKTYTATVIWRRYLASQVKVIRETYRNILINLRSCFSNDSSESAMVNRYAKAQILMIEDLAACKNSDFSQEVILQIIDSRLENCLPTIITSNISPDNIGKLLGERFSSRLKTYLVIKLGGTDKRCR